MRVAQKDESHKAENKAAVFYAFTSVKKLLSEKSFLPLW
jgi:hypothetical protein